jgi:hypothetical protein
MQSPVYQNVVTVRLSIKRSPSEFVSVAMWDHWATDNYIFGWAKFTTMTILSLLISCTFLFQIVGLKTSFLHNLALKSRKDVHILFRELTDWSQFLGLLRPLNTKCPCLRESKNANICDIIVQVKQYYEKYINRAYYKYW